MAGRTLDALLAAAGIDPADGVQAVAADRLASVAFDPSLPLIVLRSPAGSPALRARPGRAGMRGERLRRAARAVPGSPPHPPAAGRAPPRPFQPLPMPSWPTATGWCRALTPLDNLASPHGMAAISARLRAPDGCPWDRKQTHASLRPFVLEEAYETVDAIERGRPADLAEELGDLFLQVILHAQLAAEEGAFDLTDVYRRLGAKIVRRHPHVFGDVEVADAAEVLRNWESIKADERADAGHEPVAVRRHRARPARAPRQPRDPGARLVARLGLAGDRWRLGEGRRGAGRAARGGARWATTRRDARLHELGDVLFATVNLARWLKLDPEEALRAANRRWIERYERVEALAASRGQVLVDLSADEKDELWNEVKAGTLE